MLVTFGSFLLLIFSGIPIFFALGVAAAMTLALTTTTPLSIVAQRMYAGLDSFPIMAIPFFVLTGLIMERGGIASRIVDLAQALVGWIPGSLYGVSTVTGTGFAAISGSGSADTAAISSMMIPQMRKRNYDIDVGAALIAAAGSLAPIIPPSIFMIVIATLSGMSTGRLFLAGVVPGLLISFALLVAGYLVARRGGDRYRDQEPFSISRLVRAFIAALPALTLPVIIVGGIVGGVFTPTEAAAIAVVVGFLISLFVYRELRLVDIPALILRAAGISAAVMIIIATASIFSWLIASQNVPALLGNWLNGISSSPLVFLVMSMVLLIVVGMFMESISAIIILLPMLMPIARQFGVDPIHFGFLVCLNLAIGLITPPYGICLYVASTTAGRTIEQIAKKIWIPLLPMLAVLILVMFFPEVALWLPNTMMSE